MGLIEILFMKIASNKKYIHIFFKIIQLEWKCYLTLVTFCIILTFFMSLKIFWNPI